MARRTTWPGWPPERRSAASTAPTRARPLAQFQQHVADGEIHWFIAGDMGGPSTSGSTSSAITAWVESNFSARTAAGVTVYALSTGIR